MGLFKFKNLLFLITIQLVFVDTDSFAQSNSPKITLHSDSSFSLYRDDKLNLEVEAEGEEIQYRWVRNDQTVCTKPTCSFETSQWTIGQHVISLVVYNDYGSRMIRFLVKVLSRPSGQIVKTVTPGIVSPDGSGIANVEMDDLLVNTQVGLGYSYGKGKANLLGKEPVSLIWNERLKAQLDGIIHLWKRDVEEHFLFEGASTLLEKNESGRRYIKLERGTLRSRSLSATEPIWSILISDWMQIDSDAKGDLIVEYSPSKTKPELTDVRITMLRGNARVVVHGKEDQESQEMILESGKQIEIFRNYKPLPQAHLPRSKFIGEIIRDSSPQYLFKRSALEENSDKFKLFPKSDLTKGDLAKVLADAEVDIEKGDGIKALAHMIPIYKENAKDFKLNFLMAKASKVVGLYDQATDLFLYCMGLDGSNPNVYFEYGEMLLGEELWDDAAENFENAQEFGFSDIQALNYYLGVAHFYLGDTIIAEKLFTHANWSGDSEEIKYSAKDFIGKIREDSILDLRAKIGYRYNSNLFHVKSAEDLPRGISSESGKGLYLSAGLSFLAFEVWRGRWDFNYDFEKISYDALELDEFAFLKQTFSSDFNFKFGGKSVEEATLGVGLVPKFEMITIGEKRTRDMVGVEMYAAAIGLWGKPKLEYSSEIRNDPLPQHDDLIDVTLWERVATSDRSNRYAGSAIYLTPYQSRSFNIDFGIASGVTAFHLEHAEEDSFTSTDIVIATDYRFSIRSKLKSKLVYGMRNFYDSEDSRADNLILLDNGYSWDYSPNFTQEVNFSYESQNSTRDKNSYSGMVASINLGLSF